MKQKIEQLLVRVDAPPLDGVYRLALGYVAASAWRLSFGPASFGRVFALYFLAFLISLRFVPLVARRVVRFSPHATAIWAQRRQLAKHFDSYQWRKLFWIGLGLALFGWRTPQVSNMFRLVTVTCLASGVIGIWRFRIAARLPWPVGANISEGGL